MSAQTKTRAQKAGKFLGIALFAFLMFFNIKFAVSDDTSGDIDLFGLQVSVFSNSTYASQTYCEFWDDFFQECGGPVYNCMCEIIITSPR
ncbi:MAG: hypothetical protein ACK4R9_04235 [Ignavibacterium sp.]